MPERVVLRGGHLLSMDPDVGDLYGGDVLVEDDRIAAVALVLRCDHSNTYPIIDPASTVVHQADTRNVDTVIVAGTILKRDGKLVSGDLRAARDRAASSLEYLLQHTTIQPNWIQSAGQPAPVRAHAH